MTEPTVRCGWTIQRNQNIFDSRRDQVLASKDGIVLHFLASAYDAFEDDEVFVALAETRVRMIVRGATP